MSSHDNHDSHEEHESHVKLMVIVFGSLLALTVITVLASYVEFGAAWLNILVAMSIATVKAGLVVFYFMHLKWEDKTTKWFSAISLPLLALLIGFDVWDVSIRMFEKLYLF